MKNKSILYFILQWMVYNIFIFSILTQSNVSSISPNIIVWFNIIFIFSFIITKQYSIAANNKNYQLILKNIGFDLILFIGILIYFIFNNNFHTNYRYLVFYTSCYCVLKIFIDRIFVELLRKLNLYEKVIPVTIFGKNLYSQELRKQISYHKWLGYKMIEYNEDTLNQNELKNFVVNNKIERFFININEIQLTNGFENELRKLAENLHVSIFVFSEYYSYVVKPQFSVSIGVIPCIQIMTYPLDNYFAYYLKRGFDMILSLLVVVFILSWMIPIVGLLIWLQDPGPIFYIHERLGYKNIPFKCFKFRTMYHKYSHEPFSQTVRNDKRVLPLSKWIRKLNIDEMPQFINVLIGDLSTVGPRPMMYGHIFEYENEIEQMYSRHLVKPGITGLAQVSGYRGEITSVDKMKGRLRMDRYYLQNWSFIFDIKIILWTIKNIFMGDKDAI